MILPNSFLRLCVVVYAVSGVKPKKVFHKMPLPLVYAYEHLFYLREGYDVRACEESIETALSGM